MEWAWATRTEGFCSNHSTAEEPLAEGEARQCQAGSRDLLSFRGASGQSLGELPAFPGAEGFTGFCILRTASGASLSSAVEEWARGVPGLVS